MANRRVRVTNVGVLSSKRNSDIDVLTLYSLVGFWINYGLNKTLAPSHKQWIIPFAVQLIPAGILFAGTFWLKESPRWLLSKGKREQALKNLSWIRQLQPDELYIVEEVAFLDAALEEQAGAIGTGFWKPFIAVGRDRKTQWRFFLGGMLFLWQNGSGKPKVCQKFNLRRILTRVFSAFRYQCHQLLLSNCLCIHWHYWYEHCVPHNWPFRCCENSHHFLLAILPHRSPRTKESPDDWGSWRQHMHVDHRK